MPSYDEMKKILGEVDRKFEERDRRRAEDRRKELDKMGLKPFEADKSQKYCDHPNTMENSTATLFWVIGMIISLLFNYGWVLCIIETIIWFKFITRHSRHGG